MTALLLAGCSADDVLQAANPVGWYRNLTGASKNDTPPDAANTANLESGSKEPYPNLDTVPSEPTRGLTEEQRKQLAQGLIADRNNAHYTDEQIRAGDASAVPKPQTAVPEEQLPYAGAPIEPQPTSPATPGPAAAPTGGTLEAGGELVPRATAHARAPIAATREASLASPTPRATPQPETSGPAPAPPNLKPLPPPSPPQPVSGVPAMQPETSSAPQQVAGVPVPALPPQRHETAAAAPSLTPPPAPANPEPKRTKSAEVAEVAFAAGSSAMPAGAAGELGKVPALHRQYGGIVRVVGYAVPGTAGGDAAARQLAAYQAALDRANAVKQVLVQAGVPANEVVAEASPAGSAGAKADRADVYVEY